MNNKGFTLIEMLIVLFIISILLLITIPNVTKHNGMIRDKGCAALVKMVQSQVEAYQLEEGKIATVPELVTKSYLHETPKCPNGNEVEVSATGEASEKEN